MKVKLLLLLIILSIQLSYGQRLHSIRFVHIGEELKPIGTLVISVEQLLKPIDRDMDDVFGRSVKTDMRTFQTVENFIKGKKYLLKLKGQSLDYKIIVNDKEIVYLNVNNEYPFFEKLRMLLIKRKCDKAVLEALKNKPY